MQGYLHRITITVAVVLILIHHQERILHLSPVSIQEGGMHMSVELLISFISLAITCIAFGIQIASIRETKNDRRSRED
jgi:hypothetical protein